MDYVLVAVLILGLGAGAFMVARSPVFWIGLVREIAKIAIPVITRIVMLRMSPADEAKMQKEFKAGRYDEWLRKKRGAPPKG